ncbi:MAG: ParB/RepB/Spo0J family partition protein [Aequoribacter sp.]|jgi:ParB family chromosome partitioning protein|uniref:ParB/RepB/Spo0J family partition protein n=1 Tax=Aequoribacter sp. TaxID=2847771 RepID=UPI003C674504
MSAKKRGLGRGLNALLREANNETTSADSTEAAQALSGYATLKKLPVERIQRGQYQPRRDIEPEALEELAESIKAQGVMQPIIVREIGPQKYEIIAGERRWRATQLAGLDTIPALVRELSDETALAMALIENIQREDLNAMEEAIALHRLQTEFELTQQEIATAVGKSRSTVANFLRLMSLPKETQVLLERGDIEMGHAKALLGLPQDQQAAAARWVVAKGLTVRETEAYVSRLLEGDQNDSAKLPKDPNIKALETELASKLGAKVQIQHGRKGKGKLVLAYNSLDELDGILAHIK